MQTAQHTARCVGLHCHGAPEAEVVTARTTTTHACMSVQALRGAKEHRIFFGPRGKSTLAYKDGETKENDQVYTLEGDSLITALDT